MLFPFVSFLRFPFSGVLGAPLAFVWLGWVGWGVVFLRLLFLLSFISFVFHFFCPISFVFLRRLLCGCVGAVFLYDFFFFFVSVCYPCMSLCVCVYVCLYVAMYLTLLSFCVHLYILYSLVLYHVSFWLYLVCISLVCVCVCVYTFVSVCVCVRAYLCQCVWPYA